MDGKKTIILALAFAVLLFGLGRWLLEQPRAKQERPVSKSLIVKVLDIGQGDAILIFAGKDTILVDSGDLDMRDRLVSLLKKEKVKKIDLLVATHAHSDHIGGMSAVLKNFQVAKVLDSGLSHTSKVYRDYLKLVHKKKIPFDEALKGAEYSFDNAVSLKVLWPGDKFLRETNSDLNNNSIVLLLQKGNFKMLLTGDIEKEAEKILSKEKLSANILKAPHHGSKTSSNNTFLQKVNADAVIISCGKGNDYGFPHAQTIKRYENNDMAIYVTATDGTVTVSTDGNNYQIEKER